MRALALWAALVCGLTPASASGEQSSPEDRRRFVSITRSLEQDPLQPGGRAHREWAMDWLVNAPDVTVTICADTLGSLLKSDYEYRGEIVVQNMFAIGAFVIEHPEAEKDPAAQQLAGVEGALNAYRSILRDKPDARSPALEKLLKTQSAGGLPDFVRKASIRCSKEK